MAIVDCAKDTHSVGCETTNTIISNGKSDLLNNNGNMYSQCIPVVCISKSVHSHTNSVHQLPNVKKVYTVPDDDIAFHASPVCKTEIVENDMGVDKDSLRYNPNLSVFKQFVVKTSKSVFSNGSSISCMESNAEVDEINKGVNSDSNNLDIPSAEGDNTVFESDRMSLHRKKLYSGRDSPVDLIHIRRSSVHRINKPKKSLHPALDPRVTVTPKLLRKWSLLRRRKMTERKRKKWSELISKKLAKISSSSQEFQDDSQTLSSVSDPKEILRRSERLKHINRKEPVLSECIELSDSDNDDVRKENLVPSSNGAANSTNWESRQDAEAVKNNPTNSQKGETPEKHVEKDTLIEIKYPVVHLERISPCEIKKHMSNRSSDEETVNSPLRNTVQLNRRSVTNIKLQRKSLRSKNFSQPSSKTCNSRLLISCQIENVDQKDPDSDESTVLLCECKNDASHDCHSISESSPLVNNSPQDILYNMANNSSHHSSSDKSQKDKNLEKWKRKSPSYVLVQMKTSEQEPANGLRKGIPKNSFKGQDKNDSSKEEILEKIKCLKAVVVLERLPQEKFRDVRIRRYTRNFFNQMKKSDFALEKHVSLDTRTAQLTNGSSKTNCKKGELRVETHTYRTQQFQRKRTINPIKRSVSSVSELRRTVGRNRHRAVSLASSDEETEFIKLMRNLRSTKRQRTESEIKRSNVTPTNIVDTTDEESDLLVNDDNPKRPSEEVESTVRKINRSTSQRKASRRNVALRKKVLERSITLKESTSSSIEVSGGVFTSARLNRKAISPATISTREITSSPIMVDTRISTYVRTSKRNYAIPKRSSSECPEKFEHSKRISEKRVQDSVTSRLPVTRLRFQTRLLDSDSESLSISSNCI